MNEHWPRWCWASLSKHFNGYKRNIKLYFEGYDVIPTKEEDRLEFRLDGPFITEVAKDQYILEVEINMLVTSIKDDKDAHKYEKMLGIALSGFTVNIGLFKFGNGPDDDQSNWGCLTVKGENREKVVVSRFGLIDPGSRVLQGTVEGHYKALIRG